MTARHFANPPAKHHYIPIFYLKRWTGTDGKLEEFQRIRGKLFHKRKPPGATGYKLNLYSVSGLPEPLAHILETQFLGLTDGRAAVLLERFCGQDVEVAPDERSSWSRFLLSLIHRNPEKMQWLKETWETEHAKVMEDLRTNYEALRTPNDPLTYEEMKKTSDPLARERSFIRLVHGVMDSIVIGTHLNNMQWCVIPTPLNAYDLLTSDRPVVISNGLIQTGSYVCLALDPRRIFVACNRQEDIERFLSMGSSISQQYNNVVVKQAARFVYGRELGMERFIHNRLGHQPPQFIGGRQ